MKTNKSQAERSVPRADEGKSLSYAVAIIARSP